ncbi:MAG: carboxypeptidase regulatory-like domain-containing protein, partial [Armatimonadota bacterium]|nr:carboxypeptidase regulatory-like domain-containing protein [Armatimonadota bacterium]
GGASGVLDGALSWITGLVTKSRGEAVAGATVTLVETGERSTTDAWGRYLIGTEYRGDGTLRAEAPGFLTLEWPVTFADGVATLNLPLVSMEDFSSALFQQLTGATDSRGTWRWDSPTVTYYIDRSGAYRAAFDAPVREAFTRWSMLTQRAVAFVESGPDAAIRVSFVSGEPCGIAAAAGCAGVTRVTAQGAVRGAFIELHAGYAADPGLALHEVGHTLSFTGHSPNTTDVMYSRMNGAAAPSNQEAAVAAVLYANPPGSTLSALRYPAEPTPAAATPAATAAAAVGLAARRPSAPPAAFPQIPPGPVSVVPIPPALSALPEIGTMVRGWFGGTGCLLRVPLLCGGGVGLRLW